MVDLQNILDPRHLIWMRIGSDQIFAIDQAIDGHRKIIFTPVLTDKEAKDDTKERSDEERTDKERPRPHSHPTNELGSLRHVERQGPAGNCTDNSTTEG